MPLFLASAVLSWKLAKMIGKRSKRRNKNIKKILQKLNDWKSIEGMNRLCNQRKIIWKIMQLWKDPVRFLFRSYDGIFLVNKVWAYGRIMLVLICTVATFLLQYRSLLTVTINGLLLCYKFFVTGLVLCLFATYVLILKWKHPVEKNGFKLWTLFKQWLKIGPCSGQGRLRMQKSELSWDEKQTLA